jgi:hypothetical protein
VSAAELMNRLGLTVVSQGPAGRYPRAEPGPGQGYRYWGQALETGWRFGVQPHPKATLAPALAAAFTQAGFQIMPGRTEAFMTLSGSVQDAADQARAVMAQAQAIVAKAG